MWCGNSDRGLLDHVVERIEQDLGGRNAGRVKRSVRVLRSQVCLGHLHQVVDSVSLDTTEHGVLVLQLRSLVQCEEELRSIVVLVSRVCHTQQATAIELEARVELILKRSTIVDSTYTARASTSGVATLDNEARNQAVEDCAIVVAVQTMLEEVSRCERNLFRPDFDDEIACSSTEQDFGRRLRLQIV